MNNTFWYFRDNENVENIVNLNLVHLVRITSYKDGNYGVEFHMSNGEVVMACVVPDDYHWLMERLGM